MSEPVTFATVLSAVERVIGAERIPPGSGPELPLSFGGLFLGSLELVEVIVACEESFGVFLDPETDLTPNTLRTLGNLTAAIETVRLRTKREEQ